MKKIKIIIGISIVFLSYMFCGTHTFLKEIGVFAGAIARSSATMGTVVPSSPYASKAMAGIIPDDRTGHIRVLEVGGGSGSITKEIISKLGPDDRLEVIEIDLELCGVLEKKFGNHKNVTINHVSILDWSPDTTYDFIISSLPFNSLGYDFVCQVIGKYLNLIKKNGAISYFEYMCLASIKKRFLSSSQRRDFIALYNCLTDFREHREIERVSVFFNFPPAYVYYIHSF